MKSIDEAGVKWHLSHPDADKEETWKAGANYVLDILEQALTPQKCLTDIGIDVCAEALVKTALQTIEQLKK